MINIKNISDKEKLDYLNQRLETDDKFKTQFIKYFNMQQKVQKSYANQDLNSIIQEIFQIFDGVNLEQYMPECGCYDYYEDDISEELCEGLFLEVVKEIDSYTKNGNFYQALFVLSGIGKAIDLEPSVDDEYGLLYDYEEILSEYHTHLISQYTDKLKDINLSFEESKKFIVFLLDNSTTPNELQKFEELFTLLIVSKDMAQFFSSNISKFHINMQLKILNILEDDKIYIDVAKQFYKENDNIARKLLKKLDEVASYQEYEIIAKECFQRNDSFFIAEIFKVIQYNNSKDFYLELLKYKVLNHRNIDEYIQYKKYLNEKEISDLQDKLCSHWSYDYCVKILEYEKKYNKILKLAQNEKNIDFRMVLQPIKFHFPQECFKIIIDKCNQLMSSLDRNRKTYKEICNLLNIMTKVPVIKDEIYLYIKNKLVSRKPNLPALKDELSKAGLLKKEN